MTNTPELLLPAGDLNIVKLAIDHGADAVYVGYKQFSARAKATNLNLEEMIEAIEYAHKHGAKIFCALNILLFNDELEDCIKAIAELVAHGLDAFIVQDFGIATLILSHFPETEVHISTQMAIMNRYGVQAVEAIGFDRVVLARETSLRAMQHIRAHSNIDLEVFVQGALCVCYSGLCYMSSLQGDRSGNRGQCAQPCRNQYKLYEINGHKEHLVAQNYLLSPKDMNLLPDLSKLMDIPVQSLKVEGRMKQPEYVALMADMYRKHIDALAANTTTDSLSDDLEKMAVVFNREGFSSAYLHGVPGESMMSYRTPKNTGIPLGELVKINKNDCTVKLTTPLTPGDGIALYDQDLQSIWGGYLDKITDINGQAGKSFKAGDTIRIKHQIQDSTDLKRVMYCYKTFDKELSKSLLKIRKLPAPQHEEKGTLNFFVEAAYGKPFTAVALFTPKDREETLTYQYAADFIVEQSRNGKSSREVIENGFNKLNNTGYHIGTIELTGPEDVFVPMSVVTKAKNDVLAHFNALVSPDHTVAEVPPMPNAEERIEECMEVLDEIPPQIKIEHEPIITVQVRTMEQARAAIEAGAEELNILLLNTYRNDGLTVEDILSLMQEIPLLCSLPPLMKEEEEETHYSNLCQQLANGGMTRFMISNLGHAKLLEDLGIEYYAGDYHMNLTNDLTASALSQIGLSRQTLSIEMDYARMQELSSVGSIPLEIVLFGKLPAMNTRYCPMGSLIGKREINKPCSRPCTKKQFFLERENKRYHLASDQFCNVYLLNDKTYNLCPHLKEIYNLCLDYWRIAGTYLTPDEITHTLKTVRTMKQQLVNHDSQKLLTPVIPNSTQGHFIKGVR